MKKILVPTDFSDGAYNAVIHAIHIAKVMGATVHVLHTYAIPPTGTAVMVDLTDIMKKNAKEELANLQIRLQSETTQANVQVLYTAEHGTVVDGINRAVEELNMDLVVMGTRGTSDFAEKWLGSNTAAAARNVEAPLIAVPSDVHFNGYKHIVFTTDLKTVENLKDLQFVGQLAAIFKSDMRFLHIQKEGERTEPSLIASCKAQMKTIFGHQEIDLDVIVDTDVDEGIEVELDAHPADLVVTVRHHYGFFERLFRGSVSQKLINAANVPVLIIKG